MEVVVYWTMEVVVDWTMEVVVDWTMEVVVDWTMQDVVDSIINTRYYIIQSIYRGSWDGDEKLIQIFKIDNKIL
jgi:hypothetical protein